MQCTMAAQSALTSFTVDTTVAPYSVARTVMPMDKGPTTPIDLQGRLLDICRRRNLDTQAVARACKFATQAHLGQFRKNGDPYVTHPVEVAHLVADLDGSLEMVIASLLHDTIEDTQVTAEDISRHFGSEVTNLVLGCTKTAQVRAQGDEESLQAERLRTLFVALADDPRVVVIKLADRLHNLRTIAALPEAKARRIALETLTIHSPLAHRLGLGSLKAELEDRAFAVADPNGFLEVEKALGGLVDLHERLAESRDRLVDHLDELGIAGSVSGRIKHRWSLYRKAVRHGLAPDHLHDLLGLRVVVDDENTCYEVLTAIRTLWSTEDDRTKDYIASPKINGYRSLHTVAHPDEHSRVEIQIRTHEMHRSAEFGPAAHWAYKDDATTEAPWLRRLLDWGHESASPAEYLEGVQRELDARRDVLLLTPAGDVVNLPDGATVIDFAYAVHTDVGNRAVGARVDGVQSSLDAVLRSGQTVEIITGRRDGPSLAWLEHATTSKARHAVRRHHERRRRALLREHGAGLVDRAWRDHANPDHEPETDLLLTELGVHDSNDLYQQTATGRITAQQLRRAIIRILAHQSEASNLRTAYPRQSIPGTEGLRRIGTRSGGELLVPAVVGLPGVAITLAGCCNPEPGCALEGVAHAGRVTMHRRGCPSALSLITLDPGRTVEAYWVNTAWQLELLHLDATNRPGLLADLAIQVQSAGGELRRAVLLDHGAILVVAVAPRRASAILAALRLCSGIHGVRVG
jgi:GTP pyrophosphokinase